MRSWMSAFSLGVIVCSIIPQLPEPQYVYLALVFPLLSIVVWQVRLLGAFSLGLLVFLLWAQQSLDKILPYALEGKDVWVIGHVLTLPQTSERSQRFEFVVSKLCSNENLQQCNFITIEEKPFKVLINLYQSLEIIPNQQWLFKVRLKRPHGFANPGGFDYEAWLFQNEVSATGYIREDDSARLLNSNFKPLSFQRIRYLLREKISTISDLQNRALIQALTIGDRYLISDEQWELFSATGTNHLMVISGLHVGLVAFLFYRLALFFFRLATPLTLYVPANCIAAVCSVIGAFLYAAVAGFSLPALRAFIMVAVFMLGQCLTRHTHVFNTFFLALALILLFDPLASQSSGFWLSFGAVAVLLMLSVKNKRQQSELTFSSKVFLLIKTQLYLFVGLFPLMLIIFQQVSLLAPVVNIIAIPFISLLVVPLCLLGLMTSLFFAEFSVLCFKGADYLLSFFMKGLTQSTDFFPQSIITLPHLSNSHLLFLIAGVGLLLWLPANSFKTKGGQFLGLISLLGLLYEKDSELNQSEFRLDILDVGQGLALLITTQNHHLIYDAGPSYSDRFNAGSGVVVPFLRSRNIYAIDRVIISHADNDHSGGLNSLLKVYPNTLLTANQLDADSYTVQRQNCIVGQQWQWDGVEFEILHPDSKAYDRNNGSCVLKITVGEYSVLLSGDIERRVERELIASQADKLAANILLAPHHGSLTSSSMSFIEHVKPDYVIFSAGYLNRFKHPHPTVSERYKNAQIERLNTANTGAIQFILSAQHGISQPALYRHTYKRLWSSL